MARGKDTIVAIAAQMQRIRTGLKSESFRGAMSLSWGFADQAVISASNFILMVLLARQLGPQSFGMFTLAYTMLLFANSMQSALFTQPHNVLGATHKGDEYIRYTSATFVSQVAFSLLAGLVIAVAGLAAVNVGYSFGPLLFAVACATVVWQIQEYCRRVFYTQGELVNAFSNDVVTYGGQVLVVVGLWWWGGLTANTAIYAVAASSLAGSMLGMWRLRRVVLKPLDWPTIRVFVGENWVFGRWLAGSQIMYWASGHLYPVLTAGYVGAAATGGLRATVNFLAPTHILTRTVESVTVPKTARAYRNAGSRGVSTQIKRMVIPTGCVLGFYLILVSVFREALVQMFLGDQYREYAWLVLIYSMFYGLAYFSTTASIILRSMGKTVPVFVAFTISTVLVLTLGIFAVSKWGLEGSAAGMIFHQVVLNCVLWVYINREFKESSVGKG